MSRHTHDHRRRPSLRARRPGFTVLEVLVSSVSAALLMAGLASALFLAGQALEGRSRAAERGRAAAAQAMLAADLEHATSFSVRTSDAVTFAVPDRNGDDTEETLSYAWSEGAITLAVNGGDPAVVLTGVKSFRLDWLSRFMQPEHASPPALDPSGWGQRW